MNLDNLIKVRRGELYFTKVATLPKCVADAFSARFTDVCLSKRQMGHILQNHPDVKLEDFLKLPVMLHDGLLVAEKNRPNTFVSLYQDANGARWKASVKITENGHEVWLSTMHRTKPKQTKAILRRTETIIQTHR
jgi:hypothetical protein